MKKAFTLVELMIVVVIIGILAAVAIPKFSDMVEKSKEGATKGQLTALRGALQVYYSDNEGKFLVFPTGEFITESFRSVMVPKYITEIGATKLPKTGCGENANVYSVSVPTESATSAGGWIYGGDPQSNSWGDIRVNCNQKTLKGDYWTSF